MTTPTDPGGLLDMSAFTQTDPESAVSPELLGTIQHALIDAPVPGLSDDGWAPYLEAAFAGGGAFDSSTYDIDPGALVPLAHSSGVDEQQFLDQTAPHDDMISSENLVDSELDGQSYGGTDVHDDGHTIDHAGDEFGWDDPGHG